jgi:hypothetical protein
MIFLRNKHNINTEFKIEKFEDTKGVIRSLKSNKDSQYMFYPCKFG